METTAAILLRRTKLSETSLIITWFTEEHGKLKTVAKGARKPRSAFSGKLDLFFEAEIQFARSSKSELHILREVVLRNPRESLRKGYQQVQLASYFVELIELVTESDHSAPELYDLLQRGLNYLETKPADKRSMLHFESELAKLLGIRGEKKSTPIMAIGDDFARVPLARRELMKTLK